MDGAVITRPQHTWDVTVWCRCVTSGFSSPFIDFRIMQPVLILHFTHSVTWSSVGWNVSVSSVSVHVCVCWCTRASSVCVVRRSAAGICGCHQLVWLCVCWLDCNLCLSSYFASLPPSLCLSFSLSPSLSLCLWIVCVFGCSWSAPSSGLWRELVWPPVSLLEYEFVRGRVCARVCVLVHLCNWSRVS